MTSKLLTILALLVLSTFSAEAGMMSKAEKGEKAPSKEQVLWTETNIGYDAVLEYNYVGSARADFGSGRRGDYSTHYMDFRQLVTRRYLMAFLVHAGAEWQRMGFGSPSRTLLPNEFDAVNAYFASDFRWSEKDMMRIQIQPGLYTDMADVDGSDFNAPIAIGYTHIPSRRFQWAIGLSINTWRESRYLPGGGFRYQVNDRWKLKFMLPTPQIEYKANDVLHVWLGSDFRGDTYRVSKTFGTEHGAPELNRALVDYQEVRVGTGFSWNIKPLIELNGETGFMVDRTFRYHNNDVGSQGTGAPYVSLSLRALFQLEKDTRPVDAQVRSMQYEFPTLKRFYK